MHDIDDEAAKGVIGEEIKSQLDAVLEYVKDVPHIKSKVDSIDERLTVVENDVSVLKAAMSDVSQQINRVETDGKMTRALVEDLADTVKQHDRDIRMLKRKVA